MTPSRRRRLWSLLAALSALGLLSTLAAAHPGLRFVDFISFSVRARRLLDGADLVHPLYPVGYPALLAAGHGLTGDVLLVGKALSVLAGAGAVWAVARWLSPGAALWLLALPATLTWGATEGTDLLTVALTLGALAAARAHPGWAGVLLGAACLTRYTAGIAVPVVLWLSRARGRTLLALLLATSPHWALALATGARLLPDQSENLAIGGQQGALLSGQTLARLPMGLQIALVKSSWHWSTRLGAAGLVVGALLRRDRRAVALLALALLHAAAVGLVFSNERLVLPTTVALSLGVVWLLPRPRRGWLLAPLAALLLARGVPQARELEIGEAALAEVTAASARLPGSGSFLTTSPWFYTWEDGWIASAILVRQIPGDPRLLTPERLRAWAEAAHVPYIAVDTGRVRRSYPGLVPLLQRSLPPGYRKMTHASGWIVLAFVPAADEAAPGGGDRRGPD